MSRGLRVRPVVAIGLLVIGISFGSQPVAAADEPATSVFGPGRVGTTSSPERSGRLRRHTASLSGKNGCDPGHFRARYYNGIRAQGNPVFARCETAIIHNWGLDGPGSGLGRNRFSAIWLGRPHLSEGAYTFTATADDRVRVWVDDDLIIDSGSHGSGGTNEASVALAGARHKIRVAYLERKQSAVASVAWTAVPSPTPAQSPPTSCSGVAVAPSDDLKSVVVAQPESATICIKPGVHRLADEITPKNAQKFIGEPGAVISGARLLTGWVKSGSNWYVDGQTQESQPFGECESGSACSYNEDVYRDDQRLERVLNLSTLGPGKFYFDYSANRIYIADDPAGHKLEGAVAPKFLAGIQTTGVTVRGLVVEKFASPGQIGAVTSGPGWTIEDNEFRFNHGIGLDLPGAGAVVRNNNIHHNGQLGIGGYKTSDALIENNEIAYNNTAEFSREWEAGASKFVFATNLTLRGNHVHHNAGNGLWTDGDGYNIVYEDNYIHDQEGNGLHHEVGCNAVIRNNRIENNGVNTMSNGIMVTASQNVEIHGNTVKNNGNGIVIWHQFREQDPNQKYSCEWTLDNVSVHNNEVTMSSGATGIWKCCGADDGNSIFLANDPRVEFVDNTYFVADPLGRYWQLENGLNTFATWQAQGNDVGGSVRP
jgi:hypothetical protein